MDPNSVHRLRRLGSGGSGIQAQNNDGCEDCWEVRMSGSQENLVLQSVERRSTVWRRRNL
jgi:hypothetical protein